MTCRSILSCHHVGCFSDLCQHIGSIVGEPPLFFIGEELPIFTGVDTVHFATKLKSSSEVLIKKVSLSEAGESKVTSLLDCRLGANTRGKVGVSISSVLHPVT